MEGEGVRKRMRGQVYAGLPLTSYGGRAMWQEKFVREFNRTFGEPFLPGGFAKAKVTDRGSIEIEIGDRDSEFHEDGSGGDSGSNVGDGMVWRIKNVRAVPA